MASIAALSPEAGRQRDARRRWALPGGRHDQLIGALRLILPAAIGVLAALLLVAPLTSGRDISFVLAKDRVDVAKERLRVSDALYRGQDSRGQPFQLRAASAVQVTSADPVVRLGDLRARIGLADGPATVTAGQGRYDMDSRRVAIVGPATIDRTDGSRVLTNDVTVDLEKRTMASTRPVQGTMPLGTFRADSLSGDLDARTLVLTGGVRLHITQSRGRAAR